MSCCTGLIGLIVAGIFASAMGAISGVINSTATIVKTDCFDLLFPQAKDRQQVAVARWATLVAGVLGIAMAAYIAGLNLTSLWDKYLQLIALIGGGLPGVFALGLLTKRANPPGVITGLLASIAITWYVQHFTKIDTFLHSFVAVFSAIVIGYVASLLFPSRGSARDLRAASRSGSRPQPKPIRCESSVGQNETRPPVGLPGPPARFLRGRGAHGRDPAHLCRDVPGSFSFR